MGVREGRSLWRAPEAAEAEPGGDLVLLTPELLLSPTRVAVLWAYCSQARAGDQGSPLQGLENWTSACPTAVLGAWFSRAGPTPPVFGSLVSTLLSVTSKVHLIICQPSQAWEPWTGHLHLNYQDILVPRGPPHLVVPTEAPSGKWL